MLLPARLPMRPVGGPAVDSSFAVAARPRRVPQPTTATLSAAVARWDVAEQPGLSVAGPTESTATVKVVAVPRWQEVATFRFTATPGRWSRRPTVSTTVEPVVGVEPDRVLALSPKSAEKRDRHVSRPALGRFP